MTNFEQLQQELNKPEGNDIPIMDRVSRYTTIRNRMMYMIFGAPGSGKSAFLHQNFILSPFDWYLEHKRKRKLKIILFAMERSKIYVIAKWISQKVFKEQGIYIPISHMFKWNGKTLSKDEHDLVLHYKDYIDELSEIVDIIEGAQNPTGIYKYVKEYAENNGKVEKIDDYHKIYIPNDLEKITIIASDHKGLIKLEKGLNSKKEAIDKSTEYDQVFRDFYGFAVAFVMQLGRNTNNPAFLKLSSFEPTLEDVKESGNPGEAADLVFSLFDPKRHRTEDESYKTDKFIDLTNGANYFRNLKILKNNYGEDQIKFGLGFMGSTGLFKELPRPSDMDKFDYNDLFNHNFFLK